MTQFQDGDECPGCAESGHTGVWSESQGRFIVCPICGDRGVLDKRALDALTNAWALDLIKRYREWKAERGEPCP